MSAAAKETSEEQELIAFIYDAFNRRDINSILQRMHPDVEWPNGMEGGWVHGREEVRAYWTRQWKVVDPRVEPARVEAEGDQQIVVHVKQIVRDLSGTILLDRMVQHVYRIANGLILRMDIRE